ncbi:MAG TPA: type I 3-dehydroquinate dehydratase [Dehalococcoidales bacterium]|nr:type I 3-dehydroquinate dehydratase [Dehalococcoidales bacterium]
MAKPRICAVIVNTDLDAVKEVEPIADLFEVRLDIIGEGWQELVKKLKKPWIATNRTTDEGGQWRGTEARRIEALLQAIELGAAMVDIEFKTKNLENIVPLVKKRVKCILSYHNLEKTPPFEDLKGIAQKQLNAGADICKVVTTAREFDDNLSVLRLVSEFSKHKIVSFAMGQAGQLSRLLSPLAGADFTYASIERGKESAPGQITVKELTEIYGMMKE